jgi:hypothetical protein
MTVYINEKGWSLTIYLFECGCFIWYCLLMDLMIGRMLSRVWRQWVVQKELPFSESLRFLISPLMCIPYSWRWQTHNWDRHVFQDTMTISSDVSVGMGWSTKYCTKGRSRHTRMNLYSTNSPNLLNSFAIALACVIDGIFCDARKKNRTGENFERDIWEIDMLANKKLCWEKLGKAGLPKRRHAGVDRS